MPLCGKNKGKPLGTTSNVTKYGEAQVSFGQKYSGHF